MGTGTGLAGPTRGSPTTSPLRPRTLSRAGTLPQLLPSPLILQRSSSARHVHVPPLEAQLHLQEELLRQQQYEEEDASPADHLNRNNVATPRPLPVFIRIDSFKK